MFSLDLGDLRILEMVDCINTVAVYWKASPLDRLVLLRTIMYYSVQKLVLRRSKGRLRKTDKKGLHKQTERKLRR